MVTPTPLRTRADLVAVTGPTDAYGRLDPPATPPEAYAWGAAVGYLRRTEFHGESFTAWSADDRGADDVAALVAAVASMPGRPRASAVSVPIGCLDAVAARGRLAGGGDWDWMWTDALPPPAPAEHVVEPLDDARDAAELAAFGPAHNPRWEGAPGRGIATRWLGVRRSGHIVACGAVHRLASGTAHLSGILVAPDLRGRGLGRAVTTALTREVVTREGACTLGVYADNTAARALYRDVGYRSGVLWASRAFLPHRS